MPDMRRPDMSPIFFVGPTHRSDFVADKSACMNRAFNSDKLALCCCLSCCSKIIVTVTVIILKRFTVTVTSLNEELGERNQS